MMVLMVLALPVCSDLMALRVLSVWMALLASTAPVVLVLVRMVCLV